MHDTPSKATLENEFGTHNEDECMIKILEGGTVQETEVSAGFEIGCERSATSPLEFNRRIGELMSIYGSWGSSV